MRFQWFLLVFAFAFLTPGSVFAQNKEERTRVLLQIRQTFQKINSQTDYQLVKLDDAEIILGQATDGGASLTGYFKGDTLCKVIEWVGLSSGVIQNEYYIDRGALVFVHSNEKRFAFNDSLQTMDNTKLVSAFSGRYYFQNNAFYEVVLSNKKLNHSTKDEATALVNRLKAYEALLRKNRK